jgi:hypothetical protein
MYQTRRLRAGAADRRGFALLAVLLALLVFGGLGAASVALAMSDIRMARNVIGIAEARGFVEQDITQAFESLDPVVLAGMPVGSTLVRETVSGGYVRRTEIRRSGDEVFSIGATVDVRSGPYRGDGVIVRLAVPPIGLDQPVSAGGPVRIDSGTGFAAVNAEDDADCGAAGLMSVPPVIGEPSEDFEAWVGRATVRLPDGVVRVSPGPNYLSRECHRADHENWGDPASPNTVCGRYLPVVYAPGNLEVEGGTGHGVLLVRGDLTLRGRFVFEGVILVGGRLITEGAGAHVRGAVQIEDVEGAGSALAGGSLFAYSPCAIGRALLGFGHLETLSTRSWIGMY